MTKSSDSLSVRTQDELTVISSVASNPIGRRLVYDYLEEKWKSLLDRHPSTNNMAHLVQNVVKSFNTNYELDRINQFLSQNPDSGAIRDGLKQSIENIKTNIRWIEKNSQNLADWLYENSEAE